MAARQGIVADVDEPVGFEALCREPQQGAAHNGRNPGVDAVRDDVVELSEPSAALCYIAGEETDVVEAGRARQTAAERNRRLGEIDADESGGRRGERHDS